MHFLFFIHRVAFCFREGTLNINAESSIFWLHFSEYDVWALNSRKVWICSSHLPLDWCIINTATSKQRKCTWWCVRLHLNLNATTSNSNQKTTAVYEAPDTWAMESSIVFLKNIFKTIQLNRYIENFARTHLVRCKTPSILACITRNPLPVPC